MREEFDTSPEAGLTLLELLVAMTLMALVAVVLLGGLRFGARVWEQSERHNIGGSEILLVQARLRHQIERAWPYFDTSDPANPHVAFDGRMDSLSFLAPSPEEPAPGGYAEIVLIAVVEEGETRLVMRMRHQLAPDGTEPREETLMEGFADLRFSYFGSPGGERPPEWQDEWTHRKRLPDLLRIEGQFVPAKGGIWPELVVAPRIDADVGCVYDPLTQFCRGR